MRRPVAARNRDRLPDGQTSRIRRFVVSANTASETAVAKVASVSVENSCQPFGAAGWTKG
jgi:hypothetical protein